MLQFLVVDDDEHVADVLKTGLEEYCGVSVTCVDSGVRSRRGFWTPILPISR